MSGCVGQKTDNKINTPEPNQEKPKLTQESIQITSVVNQNKDVACNNPSLYGNWWIEGFISDSVVPEKSREAGFIPDFMNVASDVYVDNNPNPVHINNVASLRDKKYYFELALEGVSPNENHLLNINFVIYNPSFWGGNSDKISKQYQVAKVCN